MLIEPLGGVEGRMREQHHARRSYAKYLKPLVLSNPDRLDCPLGH